jgi:FkbM family methyltransferase
MASHNPVFSAFLPFRGQVPPHHTIDFLGATVSREFVARLGCADEPYEYEPILPFFDEEYFEWIHLLEAVLEAQDTFTMIELGAGFGRWVVRGGLAARQRNLRFHLIAAEAEPTVYGWLRQNFANNGIPPDEHTLLHGAVTESPGPVAFYIGGPRGGQFDCNPNEWYGQCLAKDYDLAGELTADGEYANFPVICHAGGWRSIEVQAVRLSSILKKLDRVDLIDMDIEGEELPIVRANIKTLDAKVKRLHIGTHSKEIEAALRELLLDHGWTCSADYSLFATAETPYGPISFQNGAQSWTNPRQVGSGPSLRTTLQHIPFLGKLLPR